MSSNHENIRLHAQYSSTPFLFVEPWWKRKITVLTGKPVTTKFCATPIPINEYGSSICHLPIDLTVYVFHVHNDCHHRPLPVMRLVTVVTMVTWSMACLKDSTVLNWTTSSWAWRHLWHYRCHTSTAVQLLFRIKTSECTWARATPYLGSAKHGQSRLAGKPQGHYLLWRNQPLASLIG